MTWLRLSGKQLRAIVVTHGHFDHFFGAGPALDAFPGSRLVACDQQVVDEARGQTTPAAMARWNALFAGQLPASPPIPSWTGGGDLDIDGSPVQLRAIGGADGMLATIAYMPELRVLCRVTSPTTTSTRGCGTRPQNPARHDWRHWTRQLSSNPSRS